MSEQPSGINITVSPSQVGGWNSMTVIFRDSKTDNVIRTIEGGNLPLPAVDEVVSFGNVATVTESPKAEPETHVDMDLNQYEVVDREFTYIYLDTDASAEGDEVEVTVDISLRKAN